MVEAFGERKPGLRIRPYQPEAKMALNRAQSQQQNGGDHVNF
jgi:hypothetical protein